MSSQKIIDIFNHYMKDENRYVSRAELESNLFLKKDNPVFNNDIRPLLSLNSAKEYQVEEAYEILFRDFLPKLAGDLCRYAR